MGRYIIIMEKNGNLYSSLVSLHHSGGEPGYWLDVASTIYVCVKLRFDL